MTFTLTQFIKEKFFRSIVVCTSIMLLSACDDSSDISSTQKITVNGQNIESSPEFFESLASLIIGQYCLYHDALTQSVQKSFGMHFNIMASIDLEGSDNSGNVFLADSNPFLMAAVNFVYECLTDPEHEIYQPDL